MIDLLAISAIERDTEMSYVRRERDWLERAQASGRTLDAGRSLPVLPSGLGGNGRGDGRGNGSGHAHAK
ncbi:MAG: hypothetical protein XU10_C0001G0074 [Chloroflexi bacterium CSP1-4]|nr:MAG: hypothetical protein XU10_C0001G0074 [Chloroflexi bacterium CSP1-4]